jgi:hypothetical protein
MDDSVIEDDIVYSLEQCRAELDAVRRGGGRQKRKVIDFATYSGKKHTIPLHYEFDSLLRE